MAQQHMGAFVVVVGRMLAYAFWVVAEPLHSTITGPGVKYSERAGADIRTDSGRRAI